ncbi:MAG TPA: hypothetical protein VL402_00055 [Xanthobacteraceae bacterium]|jgi:tripartite-type tricarboxylate transporter receptor subunit TctC|nr:hypothetical protein [Xanthobacteraceae bacterium]
MTGYWCRVVAAAGAVCIVSSGVAFAQPAAEFYKGKTVSLIVSSAVGGGYDLYARFLSRYMGRHLPGNPTVIVKNMPGASGITAANYLYSVAPHDGLTLGILQNTITLNQLGKIASVKFDMRRFGWLGSMSIASSVCALTGPAKTLTAKDLFSKEVIIGASGGSTSMMPDLLNNLAGMHLKVVRGYASTGNVVLAMERGEVNGICGWSWDGARVVAKDMLAKKVANIVVDIAIQPQDELKKLGVPFLMDLLPEGEPKEVFKTILTTQVYNRPFAVPPGVPEDRTTLLREAFAATLKDPEVLAEAEKVGLDIQYLPPQRVIELINLALNTPPNIQARTVEELTKAGFK